VRLRAFRDDDLHELHALHSDPRVMRYWSFPAWTGLDQAREYLVRAVAARDASRMLCWALARREDDRLIGAVTLYAINHAQQRAEIGYALQSGHWGRGYAGEALDLALGHAFDALSLRRVEADIDPRNSASCALVERLGFEREGLLRERWHVAGELCDTALYGLLARDWPAVRERLRAAAA
jgi:RimJ/RimL family protein N-acetyltransferase